MAKSSAFNALAAALLFGASTPLAKILVPQTTPQALAGIFYLGSGLGLGIYWIGFDREGHSPFEKKSLPWLSGAILFGGILAPLFLFIGVARTPASTASLLLNLEAVFTAFLAWTIFKEHISRRFLAALLFIVAGGVALSWQGSFEWSEFLGPLAVAAACASWGVDNNLTRKISHASAPQITAVKGLAGGAVNLALALLAGDVLPGLPTTVAALAVGFVGYGLSLVFFVRSLRKLGAARTGAYFATAPFAGALGSVVFLGESLTPPVLMAGALMAAGLYLQLTESQGT
ncbi:MAG: DMT family transporter [Bdellovibrionota bacterium]